jgi:nitrate/TMAO reductase-like tetraheme cytochrome c subunit
MSDDGSSENKRKALFSRLWAKPRVWWMVGIPIGGFLMFGAGIIFWGGFNTAVHLTNSLRFCTSCHEMETVYEEYKESPHYKNASGVRAICPDCHVPREWGPMMAVKLRATINELPKKIMGTIDTPEKFEARRLELAKHVWKRMKETDSRECRNCHSFGAMELELQDKSARKKHIPERALEKGETCIDCHKGIAHELPEGY